MQWQNCLARLREGGIHLIASKGGGKTVAKMSLARLYSERADTKVIIMDTLPNWQWEYDCIPYFVVTDNCVIDKEKMLVVDPQVSQYIMTEKRYQIAEEPLKLIDRNYKALLYSIEIQDPNRIGIFESEVISYIYNKQRIKAKYQGPQNLREWYVIVIEECENVFSSSSLERRAFNRIRKQYSECANLKIAFISSSQRLQEVSTKFRGKMNYLIGKTSIEDFDLKLRRMLRYSKHKKDILNLPIGHFLNTQTDEIIKFPIFKRKGDRPFEIIIDKPKPTTIKPIYPKPQKKKGFLRRLLDLLTYVREDTEEQDNWEEQDDEYTEEIDSSHEEDEFIPM